MVGYITGGLFANQEASNHVIGLHDLNTGGGRSVLRVGKPFSYGVYPNVLTP
jgi:hypothetical protein